jgi:hypothetical protein
MVHSKIGKNALNKCKWSRDGSKIMTGDSQGYVNIMNLEQKYLKLDNSRI